MALLSLWKWKLLMYVRQWPRGWDRKWEQPNGKNRGDEQSWNHWATLSGMSSDITWVAGLSVWQHAGRILKRRRGRHEEGPSEAADFTELCWAENRRIWQREADTFGYCQCSSLCLCGSTRVCVCVIQAEGVSGGDRDTVTPRKQTLVFVCQPAVKDESAYLLQHPQTHQPQIKNKVDICFSIVPSLDVGNSWWPDCENYWDNIVNRWKSFSLRRWPTERSGSD